MTGERVPAPHAGRERQIGTLPLANDEALPGALRSSVLQILLLIRQTVSKSAPHSRPDPGLGSFGQPSLAKPHWLDNSRM